jgi:hypothetical protein
MLMILASCSFKFNLMQMEGEATEKVDKVQTVEPVLEPQLNYGYRNGPSAPRDHMPQPKNLTGPIGSS